jgi:hypothetical protein
MFDVTFVFLFDYEGGGDRSDGGVEVFGALE